MSSHENPATWPEATADTWPGLVQLLGKYIVGGPTETPYVFRGQSDCSWPLVPSLLRTKENPTSSALHKLEKDLRGDFQSMAHLHVDPALLPDPEDVLGWWAQMQHFGVPTRLLDWTASPYVAAYFAVSDAWDRDGAVFLFHTGTLNKLMNERQAPDLYGISSTRGVPEYYVEEGPGYLYVWKQKRLTTRTWVQQGGFTVSTWVESDHGATLMNTFGQMGDRFLLKIRIPATSKPSILRQLRAMNVTAGSLFPGLDGAGRSGFELWRLAVGGS